MAKGSRFRVRIAVARFGSVFDNKAAPAKSAEQVVPSMQIFQSSGFAMQGAFGGRRQGTGAIVRLVDPVSAWISLETRRLFVLADVEAISTRDARHFAINAINVRDITGAHWL